jgi:hypothetical protein
MALPVQNGVFSASLSWSSSLFSGAARWIEVRVRPTPATGSATLDTVAPYAVLERQRILSTPYAFRSLTAATVESVPVQSLPASVPLIGSGGKLDSALLGTDIARSSEVASLAKEDVGLKGSIKVLEDANTARVADVATLTGNLKTAQEAQTASLNALSTQVDAKVASLAKEDVGLKGSIKTLEDANTARVADVATLTGNLKTAQEAQTGSLNALSTQVDAKVASLAKEDVGLKGSIKVLEDANTARVADVATLTGNLKTAQEAQTASLNALSTQVDAKVASLTQKDAALQASVKTLEDANTARVAENASLSANLKSLQDSTVTSVNALKGQISAQGEASAKDTAAIQQSIQSLNGANAVRISDIAALTANLQNLQAKWTSSQEAMDAKLAALTAENVALKQSVQVIAAPTRSGWMAASFIPADPDLVRDGFSLVSTVPAPDWKVGSLNGAPTARIGASSVWTGQEWIVWGGLTAGYFPVKTGARYRADLDLWSTLAPTDAPTERSGHSAVWTGKEMIVWGGVNKGVYLNDGSRYTPSLQGWVALNSGGAPSARTAHSVAWTGRYMVIFGGRNNAGVQADGGLYDPVANSWSPMPVNGAPPGARMGATMIWTGSALIVWGGFSNTGHWASGAVLSFNAQGVPGAWTNLAAPSGFSGRMGHVSAWDGQRLMVWGGRSSSGPVLGDGAVWDSVTGVWTALETSGAPTPRYDASGAWTGEELVVFGGNTSTASTGITSTGAAWRPGTGWRPLSAPVGGVARSAALSAWTGSSLLVFGGVSPTGLPLADLQRLEVRSPWYLYRRGALPKTTSSASTP